MNIDDKLIERVIMLRTNTRMDDLSIAAETGLKTRRIHEIYRDAGLKSRPALNYVAPTNIDLQFWDKDTRAKHYIHGAKIPNLWLGNEGEVIFRNSEKKLVRTYKQELHVTTNIRRDTRTTDAHFVSIRNREYHEQCQRHGIHVDKKLREFPVIEQKKLPDFIRGFTDGQGYVHSYGGLTYINIHFYNPFIEQLRDTIHSEIGIRLDITYLSELQKSKKHPIMILRLKPDESREFARYIYQRSRDPQFLALQKNRDLLNLRKGRYSKS